MRLAELLDEPSLDAALLPPDAGAPDAGAVRVAWLSTNELIDPTPFVERRVLLVVTGIGLNITDERTWDAYVERLVEAGVAALGFRVGVAHAQVPGRLVAACRRRGLPLLALGRGAPFSAVERFVLDRCRGAGDGRGPSALARLEQQLRSPTPAPRAVARALEAAGVAAGAAVVAAVTGPTSGPLTAPPTGSATGAGPGAGLLPALRAALEEHVGRVAVEEGEDGAFLLAVAGSPDGAPDGRRDGGRGGPGGGGRRDGADGVGRAVAALARTHPGTAVVVSGPTADPEVVQLQHLAALPRLAGAAGPQRAPALDPLGLLTAGAPAAALRAAELLLGPLRAHDERHGSQLELTLRTHLRRDARPGAVAAELHLHRNTLSHRLRRIEELSGLPLARLSGLTAAVTALGLLDASS